MARIDVIMPQMGESIAEGTLSKWLKKVGDEVKRDEPIFEISTDKVDAEIPAPSAGVLAEILVTEGQTVAVQTVVARLETDEGGVGGRGARRRRRRAGRGGAGAARRSGRGAPPKRNLPPRRPRTAAVRAPQPLPRRVRQRQRARGPPPHEVVAARSQDRGRARHRDRRAAGHRHRRPRHQAGHRCSTSSPARAARAGRARRAVDARAGGRRVSTARRPSRGPATSSSRCRRCAR